MKHVFCFQGVNITNDGLKLRLTTDIGLTVGYSGVYNVFVQVSSRFKGKVNGLCGNFNGKMDDDFTTTNGTIVHNAATFGNSWNVETNCKDATNPPHPCQSLSKPSLKVKSCLALKEMPFKSCNDILDPDSGYIKNCEYDVCASEKSPDASLCEAYAAYSKDCDIAGVNINWEKLSKLNNCSKSNLLLYN